MTQQEITALTELLRRTLLTTAEALWVDALIKRLMAEAAQAEKAA